MEGLFQGGESGVLARGQILLLIEWSVSGPLSPIRALLNSVGAHCCENEAIVVEWPLYIAIVVQ